LLHNLGDAIELAWKVYEKAEEMAAIAILNENLDLSSLLFVPSAPLRLKNPGNYLG
jgi:hypothetical protein